MPAGDRIRVMLPGKGDVVLTAADHVATGGEGSVYLKNGHAFKLFLDPVAARARGIAEKVRLLAGIRHPYIVAPIDVVLDGKHETVGYYMPAATGVPLVKTFTNTWRAENRFDDEQAARLVENMRATVSEAHRRGALLIDGNEMNWLADGVEPRVLDVDSWQIGPFVGTAIMASIIDYHSPAPDAGTDWFAWAIVTFQVFSGVHPYKGGHPDFQRADLEGRMRANASVFDPRVRLNAAVRPFSTIPTALRDWYQGVFQEGERGVPPSALPIPMNPKLTTRPQPRDAPTGILRRDLLLVLPGAIRRVANGIALYGDDGRLAAHDILRDQALPGASQELLERSLRGAGDFVRAGEGVVWVGLTSAGIQAIRIPGARDPQPLDTESAALPLHGDRIVVWGNRAFALNRKSELGMAELVLQTIGDKQILAVRNSWPVAMLSTRVMDGFAITDCLGAPFVVMPEGEVGLRIARAAELQDYRVINGYGRSASDVVVVAQRRADDLTYRLRLQLLGLEFEVRDIEPADDSDLRMVTTPRGVSVAVFDDAEVRIWGPGGAGEKTVADASALTGQVFFGLEDRVCYWEDRKIFRLSMP